MFSSTTAFLSVLSSRVQPNVRDSVHLGLVDFVVLLSQGVLGDLLESVFYVDGLLGAGLEVRDVVF